MPALDLYHDTVGRALIKDGWTITHDPYRLSIGEKRAFVDLAAERLLAAERGTERIAVEVKSFLGQSDLEDFENAVGQFVFYRSLIQRLEPDRRLFLAVPADVFVTTLRQPIVLPVIEDLAIKFVAFDPVQEVIVEWTQ